MEQGKFWEYHDKLFENLRSLADNKYAIWAKELGLDVEKFNADFAKAEAKVKADMAEGKKAGVRGTPSLYINGRKFQASGGYSKQAFINVIDKEILKK